VIFNFAYADVAGRDRPIVVMSAVARQNLKTIARHKENIARAKRAKRPTVKLKTAADTEKIKINQKTWMMLLPQPGVHGLWHL
jgi:hypothetical protein